MAEATKVKILGISGAPRRRANTELAVTECLKMAESLGNVETEFVALADYKLLPCKGCWRCFGYARPFAEDDIPECFGAPDDINILYPKLMAADGYIFGFSVYVLGVPGIVRIFQEKSGIFGPMAFAQWIYRLKDRPMGVISVGGVDNGGQEATIQHMWDWIIGLGMYPAAALPTVDDPMPIASIFGGLIATVDARGIYAKNAWTPEASRVQPPTQGMRNLKGVRNLARNVVEITKMTKAGKKVLEEQGITLPSPFTFPRYSVKPKKGTWVEKMVQEGRVEIVSYASEYEEMYEERWCVNNAKHTGHSQQG